MIRVTVGISLAIIVLLCAFTASAQQMNPEEIERTARSAIDSGRIATPVTRIEEDIHELCRAFTGTFFGESRWWPRGSRVMVIHVDSLSSSHTLLDQPIAKRFMESHGITFTKPLCTGRAQRWVSGHSEFLDQHEFTEVNPIVITIDPKDGRPVAYLLRDMARYFQQLKQLGENLFEYAWIQGTIRRNEPYASRYYRLSQ